MWILHRVKAVEAACELATKAVRAYADQAGGIPADGGKLWGRHVDTWTEPDLSTLDEGKLATVERLGLHTVVEHKLSSGKVKAALKERGLKGKALEGAYEQVVADLTEAGLTAEKSRAVYTARKGTPVPPPAEEE
jgi:hypothetical protein